MNNNTSTSTPLAPALMSGEKVVEFMKRSKNPQEWKVRESQLKLWLRESFNKIWDEHILLSGVDKEMFKNFKNHTQVSAQEQHSWSAINIAEDSGRIAPL